MPEAILLLNDQPVTCPICGRRTDWEDLDDGTQRHTCLSGHVFLAGEDVE